MTPNVRPPLARNFQYSMWAGRTRVAFYNANYAYLAMSWNGIMYPLHDRRKFGRRDNCSEGWIRVRGKPRMLCKVRNQTPAGAFLECDDSRSLPFHFELILDGITDAVPCEIRHTLSSGVGVFFIAHATEETGGKETRSPIIVVESDAWTGGKTSKSLRPIVSK